MKRINLITVLIIVLSLLFLIADIRFPVVQSAGQNKDQKSGRFQPTQTTSRVGQEANDTPYEASSSEHVSFESRDVRLEARPQLYSTVTEVGADPVAVHPNAGLAINATFDSSITSNPNSVAIQAMINNLINIYQSLFKDPV